MNKERYIGLMSGTSLDAIDAALIEFPENQHCQILMTHSEPIPATLKQDILALFTPGDNAIARMGRTDAALGHLFAKACHQLLTQAAVSADTVRAIGSHGQTIRHMPDESPPYTVQIGDPNIIAAHTHITTIADFRRKDMALGGQAAPLAPAFHRYLLQDHQEHRFVLNIGGIANVTVLSATPGQPVLGYDVGPGNTLLDTWCELNQGKSYDHNGAWAASGAVNQPLLIKLLNDPYFAKTFPKSTGREYFNLTWLEQYLNQGQEAISAADVQATLLELTAQSVNRAIAQHKLQPASLWVCGGGALNLQLMQRLTALCAPLTVTTTSAIGIDPDWIEAAAFAWLAQQALKGLPGNIPSVTGAKTASILGAIYLADPAIS